MENFLNQLLKLACSVVLGLNAIHERADGRGQSGRSSSSSSQRRRGRGSGLACPLMDGVEGVAAGEPGEVPARAGPTEDGLWGHFILVRDPGARRTNLVEATPVGSGAGKGGQSTKGSQGLAKLVGVDGLVGGDMTVQKF